MVFPKHIWLCEKYLSDTRTLVSAFVTKQAMADSQEVFQNEETVATKLCEPPGDDVITDMLHEWESHTDGWRSFPVDDLILNMPLDFELKADEIMAGADNSTHGLSNEKRGTSEKVVHRKAATKAIWRKYGKKNIMHKGKKKGMLRCYYKCNYRGCDGKKVVDYVDTLPVDSYMTIPHSKNYCDAKACSLRLPEDGGLKPEDIDRLANTHAPVYRIERLLATCTDIVCVDMRLSSTSTDTTISEAFADSHLDVSAWVGQSLFTVCTQMVQTGESERPMDARFYRTMVALPSRRTTSYSLLKIKTIDDKSEHATIMISKEDCTF